MKCRFKGEIYEGITCEERAKIQGALEVIGIGFTEHLTHQLEHLRAKSIVRLIVKRMDGYGYAVGELYAIAKDLIEEEIMWSIRYGEEADLKRALCEVLEFSGHDSYCGYIMSVDWAKDEASEKER